MRVAIVGAGVAGLTAAVTLQRDGHDVAVLEQAESLRASGFGLNLWSNATTLLDQLGVDVPGEPFAAMDFRSAGRVRTTVALPPPGSPHVNVDRGALLRTLAHHLEPNTIRYGETVSSVETLLSAGADLVVAADGAGSRLRPDADRKPLRRRPWVVWQAVVDTTDADLELGPGCVVVDGHRFVGAWRLPHGGFVWFVEQPGLPPGIDAVTFLDQLSRDADLIVAAMARATPVERFGRWEARDRWPTRGIIGDRLAIVGDAAHPMVPCIGQGACLAIEDAFVLTDALRGLPVDDALAEYRTRRLRRIRSRVAIARVACALRRPSPVAASVMATPASRGFVAVSGAILRRMTLPLDL
jgi:FAD-dependent urate hydroxylase